MRDRVVQCTRCSDRARRGGGRRRPPPSRLARSTHWLNPWGLNAVESPATREHIFVACEGVAPQARHKLGATHGNVHMDGRLRGQCDCERMRVWLSLVLT
jgi:hypothetical protein